MNKEDVVIEDKTPKGIAIDIGIDEGTMKMKKFEEMKKRKF